MKLRKATQKDKKFVKNLDEKNMRQIIEDSGEKYRGHMFDIFKPANCFIIEEKEPIGFTYFNISRNKLDIWSIQIKKEYIGKGFGKKFMQYLVNFAKEKSLKKITLEANIINKRAIGFYNKFGFKEIKSKKPNKLAFEYKI